MPDATAVLRQEEHNAGGALVRGVVSGAGCVSAFLKLVSCAWSDGKVFFFAAYRDLYLVPATAAGCSEIGRQQNHSNLHVDTQEDVCIRMYYKCFPTPALSHLFHLPSVAIHRAW